MKQKSLAFPALLAEILILTVIWSNDPLAQTETFSVKVSEPARDGIEVKRGMTVKGTASIPSGHHLWVLLHRRDFEGVWWPQGEGKIDPITKEWKVAVTFGQSHDIGWEFEIAVIIVKEEPHIVLQNYRIEAMKIDNWTPIEAPPSESPPLIRIVKKVSHN